MLIKVTLKENLEKMGWYVTNMYFPKQSLITVFDEKKCSSKLFSKIIIVCSFYEFIIKAK